MAYFEVNKKPQISFPSVSGAICAFNSQYAGLPLKSHEVDIDYIGSAISGVHIQNTAGINQWDEEWELGTFNTTTGANIVKNNQIRSKNTIRVLPNTEYYFPLAMWFIFFDSNKNVITSTATAGWYVSGNSYTRRDENPDGIFTTPANACYLKFYMTSNYGATYNNDISINYPSTDHDYHAFVGTSETISFSSSIYGGQYDCLTGIVTSDKDSGGGDIAPTYQQTETANCETSLGRNNIWADTGDTTLQYIKLG